MEDPKKPKRALLVAGGAVVVLVAAALVWRFVFWSPIVSIRFAQRSQARAAGEFAEGWLPAVTPPSGHELWEIHNTDTNQLVGGFDFGPQDADDFARHLAQLPDSTLLRAPPPKLRGSRIPPELGPKSPAQLGLKLYRTVETGTRGHEVLWAVDWRANRAYFWSKPSEESSP